VRELCGKIAIRSEPGKGTRLEVLLPRERESQTAVVTE
jgi:signal transduction histidine kinase